MSNTPSDAEIIELMRDGYNCRYNDEADHIEFARAVLAKWAAPQPAPAPLSERDAVMEKHFQAVEAQVKLIHERDALKQKLGPALEAALGELMYGTCPKAITIVKAAIDAAKEQG